MGGLQKLKQSMAALGNSKGFVQAFDGLGQWVGGFFVSLIFAAFIITEMGNVTTSNSSLVDALITEAENAMTKIAGLVVLIIIMVLARIYRSR